MESKDTKQLNVEKGKKGKNNKGGVAAGLAVGAAGVAGAVAGYAAEDLTDSQVEEQVEQDVVLAQNTPEPETEPEPETPEVAEAVSVETPAEPVAVVQPETPVANEDLQPISANENIEPVQVDTEVNNVAQNTTTEPIQQEPVQPVITGDENPDDVADNIISGEEIDPNDIDAAEVIVFDEVGTVYTVEGETYAAATFHDSEGNEMIMADLDADDQFDVIMDPNMEVVAELEDVPINYSDAEMMVNPNPEYMACTDIDAQDDMPVDDYMNDMTLS